MEKIPFDRREGYIWIDGQMVPWADARVHYLTHALHYGTQVFEGERAYNGRIFKSLEHSQRLIKSAGLIRMDMEEYSQDLLERIKQEVMEANKLSNAYLRMAAWRGSEQMGIDVRGTKTRLALAAWDWGRYFDPKLQETGISLMTSPWVRPAPNMAPVHSKTASNYNIGCIAKNEATSQGYNDVLMHDFEGYLAESSGANLFMVIDGVLTTPLADRFLNGITRQSVMELAKKLGVPLEERRVKPEELQNTQEVFLTGTAAEITPVGKIDDQIYKIGPVTRKLKAAYEEWVHDKAE